MIILRFDSFSGTLEKIQTSGRRSSAFNSDQQQIHPYLIWIQELHTEEVSIAWICFWSRGLVIMKNWVLLIKWWLVVSIRN